MVLAKPVFAAAGATFSAVWTSGCNPYAPLPENPASLVMSKPAGDATTYRWHAESGELRTYWGRQRIRIAATGTFPDGWREPGEEAWEVKAVNHEGKNVPFRGVLLQYKDKEGRERAEVRPAFDVEKMNDGLYIFIESRAELGPDGKVSKIRPVAHVREIRRTKTSAGFTPYWVEFPLIPETPTDITPEPPREAAPKGTPIPR
ncbi:MAG: hypothetical protein N3A38_14300 [Planctomycetota bacterium]|nr:hypothetical protein [Planctomycetota bacterium]